MDWRKHVGLGKRDLLGVDIGSAAVKVVALRKKHDKYTLTAAAAVPIDNPSASAAGYRVSAARALQDALRTIDLKTRCIVCGVCGPEVAVRDFRFPALPEAEIDSAIDLEARQVCPFNIDTAAVDFQMLTEQTEHNVGILAAATNTAIRTKLDIAKTTSLKCVLMDIDGLALLNAYLNTRNQTDDNTDDAPLTAVLNIGATTTIIAVSAPNGLPFVRDIGCASTAIIKHISDRNDLPATAIERYLSSDPAAAPFDLNQALEAAAAPLIGDIAKSLRYYAAQQDSRPIERILACGGFTLVPGFVDLLNRKLQPQVDTWNPFDDIQSSADPTARETAKKNGPAFAVATGLAMRSV